MRCDPYMMVWRDGEIAPWEGKSPPPVPPVHETIQACETEKGTFIVGLRDSLTRLEEKAHLNGLALPYSLEKVAAACRDVVSYNALPSAEIRPGIYSENGNVRLIVTAARTSLRKEFGELPKGDVEPVELWPPPEYAEAVT